MKQFYTYELINSITNEVIYVGKGSNSRMYAHLHAALHNYNMNPKFKYKILSILKNGGTILYNKINAINEQEAFIKEIELIKKHKDNNLDLCNLTDGGEGISGHRFKRTEESKKRISDIMKGKPKTEEHKKSLKMAKQNNPNNAKFWKNKTFSDEHKQKLSQRAQNRKPMTEEHKRHISENNWFRTTKNKNIEEIYGPERAEKMRIRNSETHRGKLVSTETKQKMSQTHFLRFAKLYIINNNGNLYEELMSKSQLSKKYNIKPSTLNEMLSSGINYNGMTISLKII